MSDPLQTIRDAVDSLAPNAETIIAVWDCAPAEPIEVRPTDGSRILLMTHGALRRAVAEVVNLQREPPPGQAVIPTLAGTFAGMRVVDLDNDTDETQALKDKIAATLSALSSTG